MKYLKNSFIRITLICIVCVTVFNFYSCNNNKDNPPLETNIQILGHKGGGATWISKVTIENTLPAIQEGLKNLDGVENDIQMSMNGTIWLYHDFDLEGVLCDTSIHSSIPLMYDSQITKLTYCYHGLQDRFYKLSELLNVLNNSPLGFPVSLEIKRSFSYKVLDSVGGKDKYLFKLADTLGYMISKVKFPNDIFVECDYKPFFTRLKQKHPAARCFLMNLSEDPDYTNTITDAYTNNYYGISCAFDNPTFTIENIKIAHDLGLKVMTWTPNSLEELLKAYNLGPDIIQTDNMQAKTELNID